VFSIAGGLLSVIELLGVVLSCCMASHIADGEDIEWALDYEGGGGGGGVDDCIDHLGFGSIGGIDRRRGGEMGVARKQRSFPRPGTPQTMMSNDL
jgi:hypothetical protein